MKRLRVLVSAYACEPGMGSEPGAGWHWAMQLSAHHEVWVLTRSNNRDSIAEAGGDAVPHLHWIYVDLPQWLRAWKRGPAGVQIYYYLWQLLSWFAARSVHTQVRFQLAHHVTFGKYWAPSGVAFLGVPFVLGPVGGGESAPIRFWSDMGLRGILVELGRAIVRRLSELDPLVRLTARRAAVALATTEETAARLRALGARQVAVFPQLGITDEQLSDLGVETARTWSEFRVISIGRLVHWKGFHLAIRAFAQLKQQVPEAVLWIVNGGPERGRLERLARALGIDSAVVFWGPQPSLAAVHDKLRSADVLVHPALHEAFGNVCLEAMAAGKPVVCLSLGGPATLVTSATGYAAAVTSPQRAVADMAEALTALAVDPARRQAMGEAAKARLRSFFGWPERVRFINSIYGRVVSTSSGDDKRETAAGLPPQPRQASTAVTE